MASSSNVQINSGYFLYQPQSKTADPQGSSADISSATEEPAIHDVVTLSREGQKKVLKLAETTPGNDADNLQLDRQEIEQLQKLKFRDQEVRTHEQAHLSAAGRYARGGMSFTYQKGPDGVAYAVGGEVGIDLGRESTPEATVLKMQTIRRSALAPANPSGADRQIAAQATAKEAQARQEILHQAEEELLQTVSYNSSAASDSSQGAPAESGVQPQPSSSYASLRSAIAAYKSIAEA